MFKFMPYGWFLLSICVLLTTSNVQAMQKLEEQDLYKNFYRIYTYLPLDCRQSRTPYYYIDALKYLYAYIQVADASLTNSQHEKEVFEALEYLENTAKDITDCMSAGAAGRGGSFGPSLIEKPAIRDSPNLV